MLLVLVGKLEGRQRTFWNQSYDIIDDSFAGSIGRMCLTWLPLLAMACVLEKSSVLMTSKASCG